MDLAMQGKLIPQDPSDEPAAEMLKRVNPNAKIITDNPHYPVIDDTWVYCSLNSVSNIIMGQSPSGDSINSNDGIEFHQGKIYFTEKYVNKSMVMTTSPTKIVPCNSLLLCVRAPVGIVNFTPREICIGRGLCAIVPCEDILNKDFAFYIIKNLQNYFEGKSTGSTFKAIGGEIIRETIIPIPPLNEQKRIVDRIEELYSCLDKIEASLQS